jgi:hypothetical protein
MLSIIIDILYYVCCFSRNKPKEQTPFQLILENVESLAHHELEYLEGHLTKKRCRPHCC